MQAQEEHVKVYINQLREEIVRITNDSQTRERDFLNQLARKDQEYQQRRVEYETQIGNSVDQLRDNMNQIEEQAQGTENLLKEVLVLFSFCPSISVSVSDFRNVKLCQ